MVINRMDRDFTGSFIVASPSQAGWISVISGADDLSTENPTQTKQNLINAPGLESDKEDLRINYASDRKVIEKKDQQIKD